MDFSSLKFRLIGITLLCVLIPGSTVSFISFYYSKQDQIITKRTQLVATNQAIATRVGDSIEATKLIVRKASEDKELVEYIVTPKFTMKPDILAILDKYNVGEMFLSIYIIDKNGLTTASTDPTFEGKNFAFRDYFIGAMEGKATWETAIGIISKDLGYYISYPIHNAENVVVGAVVGKLNPNILSKIINTSNPDTVLLLVDELGVVLDSNNASKKFKFLYEPTTNIRNIAEAKYTGKLLKNTLRYDLLRDSINSGATLVSEKFLDEDDNETDFIVFQKITNSPFAIVAESSEESINQQSVKNAVPLLIMFIVNTIFVSILVTVIINRFLSMLSAKSTENERFKLAVDSTSDHIVITDPEGHILYANKSVERITGFPVKDIIGKTPALWGKQMPKEFFEHFWEIIKVKKQPFTGEIVNRRKNGLLYDAEVSVAPVIDKNGEVKYFVGVERDITKTKEIDKMKSEFVSLASHQLRTPLSGIKWYMEMMLKGDMGEFTPEQKQALEDVNSSNERMIELVNALLNISRIESGKIIIDPVPTKACELIQDTVQDVQNLAKDKGVTIKFEEAESNPQVDLDPKLIRQAITNLLTNSIKYSKPKGNITISLGFKQNQILIKVEDNGIGIPEASKEKIFSKFYRADNAAVTETDGNGLGLYLVKAIVESSGGKIEFTSKENVGTTFTIILPINNAK